MSSTNSAERQLLDDACAVIDESGGSDALIDDLAEFRELRARIANEHSRLMGEYPDMWIAMVKDGVVAAGATRGEVLEAVDRTGIARSDTVVEFIDTDPPLLIL